MQLFILKCETFKFRKDLKTNNYILSPKKIEFIKSLFVPNQNPLKLVLSVNTITLGSRFGFQSAQSAEVDDIPSSALDPIIPSSDGGGQYSQGYNLDTHGHLSNRNAADAVGKWAKDSFGDLPGAKTIGKVAKKVGQTRVAKAAKKSIDSMKGGYDFMSKANPDAWEKFKNSGYKR